MGTTRGVLCPQDRAFLHTNVAIPPGMMRDQSLQRGYLLVVLHAIVLRAPELFYPICPSIVCHDLSLSHPSGTRAPHPFRRCPACGRQGRISPRSACHSHRPHRSEATRSEENTPELPSLM